MDLGKMAKIAADLIGGQLAKQEGVPFKFKAAIIRTRTGDYLISWEEGNEFSYKKLENLEEGAFGPSLGPFGEHPPTFDLRNVVETLAFPLKIPYDTMAHPLAGRKGYVIVHSDGRIEDHCELIS